MWYTIFIPEGIAAKSELPLSIKTLIKILKQFESESMILLKEKSKKRGGYYYLHVSDNLYPVIKSVLPELLYIPTNIVQPAEHETLFEKY